jgi:cyclic pyranopterin monophosphate synthase
MNFSHYSESGDAVMVDVSKKAITIRTATARGFVRMATGTIEAIEKSLLPKGNPFETAKSAGILAAKQTASLIPMCHPLLPEHISVDFTVDHEKGGIVIHSSIRLEGKTGAEMEALTAVSVAALTVYDMCKAIDKEMVLEDITLTSKSGGKSDYIRFDEK